MSEDPTTQPWNDSVVLLGLSQKERAVLDPTYMSLTKIGLGFILYLSHGIWDWEYQKPAVVATVRSSNPKLIIISQFNHLHNDVISELKEYGLNFKVVYVDHGVSFLKSFVEYHHAIKFIDRYLLSNEVLRHMYCGLNGYENINKYKAVGYTKSDALLSMTQDTRSIFCEKYKLDPNNIISLYAPSWVEKDTFDKSLEDEIFRQLRLIGNFLSIQHFDGLTVPESIRSDGTNIIEAIKHADIVISDLSSVMFEASVIGKPIIQILRHMQSNNASRDLEPPVVPYYNKTLSYGYLTTAERLAETIHLIAEHLDDYKMEFEKYHKECSRYLGIDRSFNERLAKQVAEMFYEIDDTNEDSVKDEMNVHVNIDGIFNLVDRLSDDCKRIITFGTFDLFHEGHFKLLKRAKEMYSNVSLVVGVSTDELNVKKKQRPPIDSYEKRVENVMKTGFVDLCFPEKSLLLKQHYILKYYSDVFIMGDDWESKFDNFSDLCEVVYLPRTPGISSTMILEMMCSETLTKDFPIEEGMTTEENHNPIEEKNAIECSDVVVPI